MENQIEHSRFLIQRYDNYTASANIKGNFLLAFNTFLIGSIISNYSKFKEIVNPDIGLSLLNIILIVLVVLSILTTFFVIKAVYPFLVSGNSSKEKYHSHVFFNSIAEFSDDKAFVVSYSSQSEEDIKVDLAKQTFYLAKGLRNKYRYLGWSMRVIYVELVLILVLLICLILY